MKTPRTRPVLGRRFEVHVPKRYTHDEFHALARGVAAGTPLLCPRCAVALDRRNIPPRRDVSYVRDRSWLVCPSCHRTAVVDHRERP